MNISLEVRSPQLKIWVCAGGMLLVHAWLTTQLPIGKLLDSPAQQNSMVPEAWLLMFYLLSRQGRDLDLHPKASPGHRAMN